MILVIAEKPSLGRDIADALPGQVTERNNRFIRKGDYAVTWVFGHMLSLKEPEDYDMKYKKWSLDDLPIYFDSWELKMGEDSNSNRNYETKAQRVGLIGELLEESESVIHAGDPDEEGQLLIDEILRWFDYKKPVKRLNTGDTTRGGLVKALSHMTDNNDSLNEGWSAYARSVADLMIGVNMSRFFTCSNSGVLLAVGRVQTPTLGLVVKRDMQIEGHIKTVYYDIFADVNVETADGNKTVTAKYTKKKQKGTENKQITELDEAEKIKNETGAVTVKADVSDSKQVNDMAEFIHKNYGKIDVIVNNAGISQQKMFTDITENDWDRMFDVNMKSMYLVTKAFVDDMIYKQSGKIINISSMWGVTGGSCEVHYSAAKAAVIGFTKALAKELGPSGICVNCVAPGVIETEMNSHLTKEDFDCLCEETPLERLGKPEEVAKTVRFLASENADFITGQVVNVDGGMVI